MSAGLFKKAAAVALLAITGAAPTTVKAGIVTGGLVGVQTTTAPSNLNTSAAPSSASTAFIFFEKSTTVTGSVNVGRHETGLGVDAHPDGTTTTYDSKAGLNGGIISDGTKVESYMLFTNAPGNDSFSGSVTFNTAILGVEVKDSSLNATDVLLGHAGTNYTQTNRGIELGEPNDNFNFSISGNTISFTFKTSAALDEIRIITAVPEPATLAMCGTALVSVAGVALRRRKAKAGASA